ncbi:MAG TPA: hypothetical protein VN934_01120 [Candidatus Tumulicola sp.]|nr:hypothetical protein [Candidatus Tumulicola sp.]
MKQKPPKNAENLRCYACGSTDVVYRIAKIYCAKCGRLIENCCGD